MIRKTNSLQFIVTVLGTPKPLLAEVCEIEIFPLRNRIEVEVVEVEGTQAIVERTDDGPALKGEIRCRLISDGKDRSGVRHYSHSQDRREEERPTLLDLLFEDEPLFEDRSLDEQDSASDWDDPYPYSLFEE